ncbi:PAS domain S-box protein [Phormidium sp. FACHB-592]|uniref:histidine kinase n=1 Tax=Stenomitos frigidus AS-A4 TaxID=2933935 RepID=A0ABV0KM87_9CYAN|nr:ATP-binding protein [Phormidium sp. FACHB-592]MBD2072472.1 PAS domain S-box protein [Phormidium sp. FACHB-592]
MSRLAATDRKGQSIQILIVEDESVIAADIKDCLENLGYTVPAIAVSGEGAITTATALHPDIVLMDIRLKGEMDGIQAAEQIWSRLRIPIIYSTGYSDRYTMERAKATGPFGYVLKPIEERELYVAIETALQRYRLDKELQEREQWLASILRAIGDGVIVVDAASRIKFLNGAAEALTGWRQEEAIGLKAAEIFHIIHEQTQAPLPNPIDIALQTGSLVYLADHTLLRSKLGHTFPIADSAAPFYNDEGTIAGVVLVFRDITERRQAEERNLAIARALQLEDQMVELQQINQIKDDFLNTVSHELRTPLTNIKMAARMLEITLGQRGCLAMETDSIADSTIRYLKVLNDQCSRQLSLVNDLLDLQRLNADAYSIELTTILFQRWLPELVENFRERAQSQQQQLHINLPIDLPPIVSDVSSLSRVLTELLNNAIKYTPRDEHITITISLTVVAQPTPAHSLQMQVCNSGVEIPASEVPHIFEQFHRIPGMDLWRQGGTGLGLTLVKKLVTYLGGSIQVSSQDGQTCFTAELPVRLADAPVPSS